MSQIWRCICSESRAVLQQGFSLQSWLSVCCLFLTCFGGWSKPGSDGGAEDRLDYCGLELPQQLGQEDVHPLLGLFDDGGDGRSPLQVLGNSESQKSECFYTRHGVVFYGDREEWWGKHTPLGGTISDCSISGHQGSMWGKKKGFDMTYNPSFYNNLFEFMRDRTVKMHWIQL